MNLTNYVKIFRLSKTHSVIAIFTNIQQEQFRGTQET